METMVSKEDQLQVKITRLSRRGRLVGFPPAIYGYTPFLTALKNRANKTATDVFAEATKLSN